MAKIEHIDKPFEETSAMDPMSKDIAIVREALGTDPHDLGPAAFERIISQYDHLSTLYKRKANAELVIRQVLNMV